jgi:hypothetical protein
MTLDGLPVRWEYMIALAALTGHSNHLSADAFKISNMFQDVARKDVIEKLIRIRGATMAVEKAQTIFGVAHVPE